jgi:dipeptidase E
MFFHRKLALYSAQETPANEEMDERLLRLIGRARPAIAYLPAASDPERIYFQRKYNYYATIGAHLAAYVDPAQYSLDADWSTLLSYDAIHLSGGNTFSFLYWLKQSNVLPVLARYVSEGGVLIGESAGAILMTPTVNSALLCGDARDNRAIDDAALSLVDFQFWPHFDSGNIAPEQSKLISAMRNLYACPDGAGIIVDGPTVELFGQVNRYDLGKILSEPFQD